MRAALVLLALATPAAWADPPKVTVPAEVAGDVGAFLLLKAETDGKAVRFYPVDPGLNQFPAGLLTDPKAAVFTAARPGRYRVLAYSGNADGPSDPATSVLVVGGAAPGPVDPGKPADPKPPVPPAGLFFAVVRPDGPASEAFVEAMGNPGWKKLEAQGHRFKEYTLTEAKDKLNLGVPAGTALPCVVTLRPDKVRSEVVGDPRPLPRTEADVLKLPEGVK
jgi:hypothetical protein